MYNKIIDDILCCKVCNFYDAPDAGSVQDSRPFKCVHFFHPLCVNTWKIHGLNITKSEGHQNQCFVCKNGFCDKYTDVCDHFWNLNGSVTKSLVNKRHNSDDVSNSVTSFPVRGRIIFNLRDQQDN